VGTLVGTSLDPPVDRGAWTGAVIGAVMGAFKVLVGAACPTPIGATGWTIGPTRVGVTIVSRVGDSTGGTTVSSDCGVAVIGVEIGTATGDGGRTVSGVPTGALVAAAVGVMGARVEIVKDGATRTGLGDCLGALTGETNALGATIGAETGANASGASVPFDGLGALTGAATGTDARGAIGACMGLETGGACGAVAGALVGGAMTGAGGGSGVKTHTPVVFKHVSIVLLLLSLHSRSIRQFIVGKNFAISARRSLITRTLFSLAVPIGSF
jgi:hypothetical protein